VVERERHKWDVVCARKVERKMEAPIHVRRKVKRVSFGIL